MYSTSRHSHETLADGCEDEDVANGAESCPNKPSSGSGPSPGSRGKQSEVATLTSIQAAFAPTLTATPTLTTPILTVEPVPGDRAASRTPAYTTATAPSAISAPALESAKSRKRRAGGDLTPPEKPQSDRSPLVIKKQIYEAQHEAHGPVATLSRCVKQRIQQTEQPAQQPPTIQQPPAARQPPAAQQPLTTQHSLNVQQPLTASRHMAQPSISEEYANLITKLMNISHAADESPGGHRIMYEEMPAAVKRNDRLRLLKLYGGLMSQLTLSRH